MYEFLVEYPVSSCLLLVLTCTLIESVRVEIGNECKAVNSIKPELDEDAKWI